MTPRLLGVILDKSLTFNAHLKKLTTSLSSSIRIIRATAHTSLGWSRSTLKMAFHALIRSNLDYAAPGWQPWLSATNVSCLDRLQNRSLRLITSQLVSTPLEALRLEADVQSYHTCSNRLILKAREKASPTTTLNVLPLLLTYLNFSKIAAASVARPTNFLLFFHSNFSTDKTSTIFHLHCGNVAPSPSFLHTRLITPSALMDPLVEEQETGVQQQLSLEDPQSSLKWLPPSKPMEERSPVPTRRKQLPWNQHHPGHPPTPTTLQSPYSFAQITNHYVKLSFHQILKSLQFTIPVTPFLLPSSFNGSLSILPFQITI